MSTGQRTEPTQIARIDLVPQTPKFREEQFRELFHDRSPTRPTEKRKRRRQRRKEVADVSRSTSTASATASRLLPIGLDTGEDRDQSRRQMARLHRRTSATTRTSTSTRSTSCPPSRPSPKQLSATSGRKRALQFSPDSKEVWYLDGGKIAPATIDPVKARTLGVTAEMDVDFEREKNEAFRQAWT